MSYTILALLAGTLAGCASTHDADSIHSAEAELSILDVHGEVNPGEHGWAVRAVSGYLQHYGYLPNPKLEQLYPYWAPVVSEEPADLSVYGAELEKGVTAFQRFMGLPGTGRVDSETLAWMQQPRCGHPENEFAALDPSDKWALNGLKWNKTSINYRLGTSTDKNGLTTSSVTAGLDIALTAWRNVTNLTLTRVTSGVPDTEIRYWTQGTPPSGSSWLVGGSQVDFDGGPLGTAWGQNKIGLNSQYSWSTTLALDKYDIQTTLTHEIGHTLGLDHSAVQMSPFGTHPKAVMFPGQGKDERLTVQPDDVQGITPLYQLWQSKPGFALDIASGGPAVDSNGNPVKPKVYAVSGSNSLFFWVFNTTSPDFGSWVQIPANAMAVAVDDTGVPWVVSSDHSIWQGNGSDPTSFFFGWIPRSAGSGANDIGASGGNVWIISNTPVSGAPGNFLVQKWTGSSWNSSNNGVGSRIAVDSFGRPWVVQTIGALWRFYASGDTIHFQTNNTPAWQVVKQLNAPNQGQQACATDVGAGLEQSVWIIGCTPKPGSNFDIWIWDEQTGFTNPDNGAVALAEGQFMPMDGTAVRITGSPDGRPWVAQASTAIFRRSPRTTTP